MVHLIRVALVRVMFAVAALTLAGCGDDPTKEVALAKPCKLDSECKGELVCTFGLCHAECADTKDCPSGQRCIQSETASVCQLEPDQGCDFTSECDEPLVCGADKKCRNECKTERDCLDGQTCAEGGVCADPDEVNADNMLKGAEPMMPAETCTPGGPCELEDEPCKLGMVECVDGKESCVVDEARADGELCGAQRVCSDGQCVVCDAGADCVPDAATPCVVGEVSCDAGPACMPIGMADDGTSCGADQVCDAGACVACVEDEACVPDAATPCVTGTVSCAAGPSCDASGYADDGDSCGTDQVCSGGSCVACVEDEACTATVACHEGVRSCENGPVCETGAAFDPGDSCGTNMVCDANTQCVACEQDAPCTPTNECHEGKMDCANGPNCVDQNINVRDGEACDDGSYYYCSAGSCQPCIQGGSCTPTNPCKEGTWYCYSNPPTCNESGPDIEDGTTCGDNQSCDSGDCIDNDRVLSVNGGNNQTAPADGKLATNVTIKLVDRDGVAVPSVPVKVTASTGAYAASATTNGSGIASIVVRVGRKLGDYNFVATAPGATPTQFTATAVAPTAKNVFTLLNTQKANEAPVLPGPGTVMPLHQQIGGIAARQDGTLYVADYCSIYELSVEGELSLIAGSGSGNCGHQGDDGPANGALLYVINGIALDEAHNLLYVAESSYLTIRVVDLTTGVISHYAGSGSASAPYGDGDPAAAANLNPSSLAVGPNGDLYVGDTGSSSIRVIDYDTTVITTFVPYDPGGCTGEQVRFTGCYGSTTCSITWDAENKPFIAGSFCVDGSGIIGIARRENDGTLVHVAGDDSSEGTASDGVSATSAYFPSLPVLDFDKVGNLYLSSAAEHKVRRIDGATGKITTIIGDGTSGAPTEHTVAKNAKLSSPSGIAFDAAGHLHIADSGNRQVHTIWSASDTVASSVNLALVSGNSQSVAADGPFTAVSVKLTDGAAANVGGAAVRWNRLDTGMGLSGVAPNTSQVSKTTAGGNAIMTGRVGLALGAYDFQASFFDIHGKHATGSPVALVANAVAPTAGHMFSILNFNHSNATDGIPGPGTFAKAHYPIGVAAASDGSLYLTEQCGVLKLSPAGEVSRVVGLADDCGFGGDGGLALNAKLYYPYDLALDEARERLYIADTYNHRVRVVYLDDGTIDTLAGGGNAPTTPWGDGGSATSAELNYPYSVAVNADGVVYISDGGHYKIRKVEDDVIDTWLESTGTCTGAVEPSQFSYQGDVIPLANGSAYVSGYFCGTELGGHAYSVVLRASNGALSLVAGINSATGSEANNTPATGAYFPDITGIALNDAGTLLAIAISGSHQVRQVNLQSGMINTVAGTGVGGFDTDYQAATSSKLNGPQKVAYTPAGKLVIADYSNHSYRMVW